MTDVIVNLEEFAELVGRTPETMKLKLRTLDPQPEWLIARGDRGRGYQIDARGGVAWFKEAERLEAESDASRRAALQQLRLELVGGAVETAETLAMSGRARQDEYGAAFKALELRKAMAELVVKADLQHKMLVAVVELRRRMMLTPGEFAIVAGLEPDQVRPLEGIIARALDAFVTSLAKEGAVPPVTSLTEQSGGAG